MAISLKNAKAYSQLDDEEKESLVKTVVNAAKDAGAKSVDEAAGIATAYISGNNDSVAVQKDLGTTKTYASAKSVSNDTLSNRDAVKAQTQADKSIVNNIINSVKAKNSDVGTSNANAVKTQTQADKSIVGNIINAIKAKNDSIGLENRDAVKQSIQQQNWNNAVAKEAKSSDNPTAARQELVNKKMAEVEAMYANPNANIVTAAVNRMRSTPANLLEQLATTAKGLVDTSEQTGYQKGDEITVANRDAAKAAKIKENSSGFYNLADKMASSTVGRDAQKAADTQFANLAEGKTDVEKLVIEAIDSISTQLGYAMLPGGTKLLSAYMGAGVFAEELNNELANGKTAQEAVTRALPKGIVSYATEAMGGIGGTPFFSSWATDLEEKAAKSFFTNILYNAAEEGLEEYAEGFGDFAVDIINDLAYQKKINTTFDWAEIWHSALVGAVSGGMFGAASQAKSAIESKIDNQVDAIMKPIAEDFVGATKAGIDTGELEVVATDVAKNTEETAERQQNVPTESNLPQNELPQFPSETPTEAVNRLLSEGNSADAVANIVAQMYQNKLQTANGQTMTDAEIRKWVQEKVAEANNISVSAENTEIASELANKTEEQVANEPVPSNTATEKAKAKVKVDADELQKIKEGKSKLNKGTREILLAMNDGIVIDELEFKGKVNGFNDVQRASIVNSLLRGMNTDAKTIRLNVPFDGQMEIVNDYHAIAEIFNRLKVGVKSSNNSNAEKKTTKEKPSVYDHLGPYWDYDYKFDEGMNKAPAPTNVNPAVAENTQKSQEVANNTPEVANNSQEQGAVDTEAKTEEKAEEKPNVKEEKHNGEEYGDFEGEEHPNTVGAQEANPYSFSHAQNEFGTQEVKNPVYNDAEKFLYDNDISDPDIVSDFRAKSRYNGEEMTKGQVIAAKLNDGYAVKTTTNKDGTTVHKLQRADGTNARILTEAEYQFTEYLKQNGIKYNANRWWEAPKSMGEGTKVTQAVQTWASSVFGSDENLERLERDIEEGKYNHVIVTNKASREYAADYFRTHGFVDTCNFIIDLLNSDKAVSKKNAVLALYLANYANDCGQTDITHEIVQKLEAKRSVAAQFLQSGTMTRGMEKMLAGFKASVESVENDIETFIESLNKQYKDRLYGKEIDISAETLQEVLDAVGTKDEGKAIRKAYAELAAQIPSSPLERLHSWRMWCMLSSPKTHARNVAANIINTAVTLNDFAMLNLVETLYKKKHSNYKMTTSLKVSKNDIKSGNKLFNENEEAVKGKFGDEGVESERRNTFANGNYLIGNLRSSKNKTLRKAGEVGNKAIGKLLTPIDFLSNFNSKALSSEDKPFRRVLYDARAAQIMEANGWTEDFLNSGTDEANEAKDYVNTIAEEAALKGTFNNRNSLADFLNSWKNMPHGKTARAGQNLAYYTARIASTGLMPFTKVSANIGARTLEHSAAGMAMGIVDLSNATDDTQVRQALEEISASLTGAEISVMGAIMAATGLLTVTSGDDDEDEFKEEFGWQKNALHIGNMYFSIDDMQPTALLLTNGALLYQQVADLFKDGSTDINYKDLVDCMVEAVIQSANTFTGMSILQSLENAILNKSESDGLGDVVANFLIDFAGQGVPNIGRGIAQVMDDEQRNAYYYDATSDKSKFVQKLENQYKNVFDRDSMAIKTNRYGESKVDQNPFLRALDALIFPMTRTTDKMTDVERQLLADYQATGNTAFLNENITSTKKFVADGKTYNMTIPEKNEYVKSAGKDLKDLYNQVIVSKDYKDMDADDKASTVTSIKTYVGQTNRHEINDGAKVNDWVADAQDAFSQGLDKTLLFSAKTQKANLESYEDEDGNTITADEQMFNQLVANKTIDAKQKYLTFKVISGLDDNTVAKVEDAADTEQKRLDVLETKYGTSDNAFTTKSIYEGLINKDGWSSEEVLNAMDKLGSVDLTDYIEGHTADEALKLYDSMSNDATSKEAYEELIADGWEADKAGEAIHQVNATDESLKAESNKIKAYISETGGKYTEAQLQNFYNSCWADYYAKGSSITKATALENWTQAGLNANDFNNFYKNYYKKANKYFL